MAERDKPEVEGSEDLSKVEKKFRLSLQNIEKRFIDLEVVISELKEQLNSAIERMEPLTITEEDRRGVEELKQRMDDIEDLLMVEQAGVVELKNIMQGVDEKLDTTALDYKISEIESIAKSAIARLEEGVEVPVEITNKISELEKAIVELQTRPGISAAIEGQISALVGEIQKLKERPGAEHMSHAEIEELRKNLRIVVKKVEEMRLSGERLEKDFYEKITQDDMKIAEFEGRVDALKKDLESSRTGGIDKEFFKDFEKHKQEVDISKAKIDGLEKAMKNLVGDIQNIEKFGEAIKDAGRFEDLKKELDEKVENFKKIEDEIRKLSEQTENMYNKLDKRTRSIDERIQSIRPPEIDLNKFEEDIKVLRKEFEGIKSKLVKRVEKKDTIAIMKAVEEALGKIDEEAARKIESGLENKFSKRLKKITSGVNKMTSRFAEISDAYKEVENIQKDVRLLSEEMSAVRTVIANISKPPKAEERPPKELIAVVDNLRSRISKIESSLTNINSTIEEISKAKEEVAPPIEEAYLKEIVDKVVFLESRLAAMETMFEKPRPIILE